MSESGSKGQDFEKTLSNADAQVAEFEQREGLIPKIQHALHTTPSLVPLIVLLMSIAVFGLLLGSKFFSPFALTLILQQVQIVGIVAIGAFVFITSLIVWIILKAVMGIRVGEEEEINGLDMAEMGMEAYPEFSKG